MMGQTHRLVTAAVSAVVLAVAFYTRILPRDPYWLGVSVVAIAVAYLVATWPDRIEGTYVLHHRGVTHELRGAAAASVAAALVVGGVIYHLRPPLVATFPGVSGLLPPLPWWVPSMTAAGLVFLTWFSHIAVDMLTTGGGFIISPFSPLSEVSIALGVSNSDDPLANVVIQRSSHVLLFAACSSILDTVLFQGKLSEMLFSVLASIGNALPAIG